MRLSDWLDHGDVPDADWAGYMWSLAAKGGLGSASPQLLLDLPALSQPYACSSGLCSPGLRAKAARSCCADLDVSLAPEEQKAIEKRLKVIREHMAPLDPRWSDQTPSIVDETGVIVRSARRCIFAHTSESGLRCGLHELEDLRGWKRGTLKPLPCRLFPLIVVGMDDGRTFLTAVHRKTARLSGSRPARAFPCLGTAGTPRLLESVQDTFRELWGKRAYETAYTAVEAWAESGLDGKRGR